MKQANSEGRFECRLIIRNTQKLFQFVEFANAYWKTPSELTTINCANCICEICVFLQFLQLGSFRPYCLNGIVVGQILLYLIPDIIDSQI